MTGRIPLITAVLLLSACVVPFALWGNPYPPEAIRYWLIGGSIVLLIVGVSESRFADLWRAKAIRIANVATLPSPRVFALIVGATTALISVCVAAYAFRLHASTSDELAMLWHARILLSGRWSLPVDPNREFFALETVVDSGRWYSQFPIGGPLFLMLGAAFHVPWLVNPVLAGGSAAAFYHFSRRAFGEAQGRACAALFAVTPMVVFMAGTWMNHVPVLFLTACALAALVEWESAKTFRAALIRSALIGACVGLIAIVRPLDGVVVALVVGTAQLFMLLRVEWRAMRVAVQLAVGALSVAPLLVANHVTTGGALTFGYDVSWGAGHRVGFHTDPYGNAHTVGHALELMLTYVGELNMYLMDWPIPSLGVIVVSLLAMRRANRWDFLLIGLFVTQLLAYGMYWGDGEFLGPRFLYTAVPALVVLTARAPFHLGDSFGGAWRGRAATALIACIAIGWCIPVFSFSASGLARGARGARGTLKADIKRVVISANIHRAVIFFHEPVSARLARRMWGVGVSRNDAAQLIATRDACSLLAAVRSAESDVNATPANRVSSILRDAVLFVVGPQAMESARSGVRVSSPASITPACRPELESDIRLSVSPFGAALPLEPIDDNGHIDGDIIYVADLGEHNEVLRARFSGRTWYRFSLRPGPSRGLVIETLAPY